MLNSLLQGTLDIIFPRNCLLCRGYHPATGRDPVCPACRSSLPLNKPPFCARCSRHLKNVTPEALCPNCRRHPPHFDEAWGLLRYEGDARELLRRFKFHDKTSLARTFTTLLRDFTRRYALIFSGSDMIIPVPLHPVRLRERGYNQSALLARAAARELGMPLREDILIRARWTQRQSELEAKERWTNIRGAFTMKNSADIVGRGIILVDDILTTSATASEAAKTLKDAGASRVTVITMALAACGSCVTTS